jgi:hypothetical protein
MTEQTDMRGRMLWVFIPAVALTACYKSTVPPDGCKNEPTAEYLSNDGQWKSVTFLRQCRDGAPEFQVSVLPSTASFSNEPGNAFRQDGTRQGFNGHHHMQQIWKGPHELWISHDRGMRVGYAASAVGAITLVHTDKDIAEN